MIRSSIFGGGANGAVRRTACGGDARRTRRWRLDKVLVITSGDNVWRERYDDNSSDDNFGR